MNSRAGIRAIALFPVDAQSIISLSHAAGALSIFGHSSTVWSVPMDSADMLKIVAGKAAHD